MVAHRTTGRIPAVDTAKAAPPLVYTAAGHQVPALKVDSPAGLAAGAQVFTAEHVRFSHTLGGYGLRRTTDGATTIVIRDDLPREQGEEMVELLAHALDYGVGYVVDGVQMVALNAPSLVFGDAYGEAGQ